MWGINSSQREGEFIEDFEMQKPLMTNAQKFNLSERADSSLMTKGDANMFDKSPTNFYR